MAHEEQTPNPEPDQEVVDLVDLEECAKTGRPVPRARRYQIRIDRERFIVNAPTITGREILRLAGKTPEEYLLHQRLRGGVTKSIEPDEVVDLTNPGPERFMTMKRETQEGRGNPRRAFRLPAADEAYLNEHHASWEAVKDGNTQWVVIPEFPLPSGFNVTVTTLAIDLVAGYPDAALDMAYFDPHLQRTDGKAIPAIKSRQFDGRPWQRWSRHRTNSNKWVVGEDNVATHIAYIHSFLRAEFEKRP
jgi:hypothetical protein